MSHNFQAKFGRFGNKTQWTEWSDHFDLITDGYMIAEAKAVLLQKQSKLSEQELQAWLCSGCFVCGWRPGVSGHSGTNFNHG